MSKADTEFYTKPSTIAVSHRLDVLEALVQKLNVRLAIATANLGGFNARLQAIEQEVEGFDVDLKTLADDIDQEPEEENA